MFTGVIKKIQQQYEKTDGNNFILYDKEHVVKRSVQISLKVTKCNRGLMKVGKYITKNVSIKI